MIAVFWPDLEALGALPVPAALELTLGLTVRQEPPPPGDQRHAERRQVLPRLDPTRDDPDDGLKTLLTLRRPRDLTSTAGTTWKGAGEHGEGKEEEEDPLDEIVEHPRLKTGVDGVDESDEALHPLDETLEDVAVDQELEDREQPDPLPHQHP